MGKDWDNLGRNSPPSFEHSMQNDFKGFKPLPRPGGLTLEGMHASQAWHQAWATEALRVLKPGGHLLAFGGSRTSHRLACAIEDAGFEIRDTISWLYGSGFPKSLDVGKAIDRAASCPACDGVGAFGGGIGVEPEPPLECSACGGTGRAIREVVGSRLGQPGYSLAENRDDRTAYGAFTDAEAECAVTAPATPEAERWEGWGTALAPAHEPIVVARKPLSGTVAATVLEWGTGAINIDASRVGENGHGRWPKNVVLDGEAARLLDEQTGELTSGRGQVTRGFDGSLVYGDGDREFESTDRGFGDSGGASRFFYVAKASRGERNAGLEGFEERLPDNAIDRASQREGLEGAPGRGSLTKPMSNVHPTVKPISLMRWLVRLVCPPGGLVCDPFCGSGTTGIASVLEAFDFIGLEREPEYVDIARARIAWWHKHRGDGEASEILAAGEARDEVEGTGQGSLFDGEAA